MSLSFLLIKKYPNRCLYNTETSEYITLEDLIILIKNGKDIKVIDAKTEEDITNIILVQIMLEFEGKGIQLLPTELLKKVIQLYDHDIAEGFNLHLRNAIEVFEQNNKVLMETWYNLANQQLDAWKNISDLWNKSNNRSDNGKES